MTEQDIQNLSKQVRELDAKYPHPLTEGQRTALKARCNDKRLFPRLLLHIRRGEIAVEDLPALEPELKQVIEAFNNNVPSPKEERQWEQLKADYEGAKGNAASLRELRTRVQTYSLSARQDLADKAQQLLKDIDSELQALTGKEEESGWQEAKRRGTPDDLFRHWEKYPQSTHADEIDDLIWASVNGIDSLRDYLHKFPNGRHAAEGRQLLSAFAAWTDVNRDDLFSLKAFLNRYPSTPFRPAAEERFATLRQRELERMRSEEHYPADRFKQLLSEGIFSEEELVEQGIVSRRVLQRIKNPDPRDEQIKRQVARAINKIRETPPPCTPTATDVYFFGIPSTGKTSILMGLSNAGRLTLNSTASSEPYATALRSATREGLISDTTPGNFYTMLNGSILPNRHSRSNNLRFEVNLVEMSGEEFAQKIAYNPKASVRFEDMGTGVTQLLQGDNEKVFFIVVDPLQEDITVELSANDALYIKQTDVLERLIGLFTVPENQQIMDKVKSIHFIMTKADQLAEERDERRQKAKEVFYNNYAKCLRTLHDVCEAHSINASTQLRPKLYTHSLGQFFLGGFFEYDETDADLLLTAICNAMNPTRKPNFWDKLKGVANQVVW